MRWRFTFAVCWMLLLQCGAARAGDGVVVRVSSIGGDCPTSATVTGALEQLLPGLRVANENRARAIEIDDQGPTYRISVGDSSRRYDDPTRQCDERARVAAVFAHSVLAPPAVLGSESTVRAQRPRARLRAQLELGGMLDGAPRMSPDNGLVAGGGSVRIFLGTRVVGAAFGVAALSPVTLELDTTRVRLTRVPFDVSLRGILSWRKVELSADLGLAGVLTFAEGLDLDKPAQKASLELGVRIAAQVKVWVHPRVAPFVGLQAVVSPRPGNLLVDGVGKVGSLPYCWLGATVGLAVRIH